MINNKKTLHYFSDEELINYVCKIVQNLPTPV